MKKKLNNSAFTMVELLAAIVILGLLSGIGITSVSKIIEKSKINYYKTEKNTFLEAGQSYVENNRELLPKNIGEVKTYKLKDLYEAKALTEKLTDENGDTCRAEESKFYVYKESSTNYKYSAILVCPSCDKNDTCGSITGDKSPTASINYSTCNGKYDNPPTATIKLTGNDDNENPKNIVSYSYKITKNGTNVYSSEAIRTKEKKSLTFTIDLRKYVPGPLKIIVTTTNEDGITSTTTKEAPLEKDEEGKTQPYCKDYLTVVCGDHNYETLSNTYVALKDNQKSCDKGDWLNASRQEGRKVWIKCDPKDGTDCKEPIYSGTYTKDSTTKNISISDAEGNSINCPVATCIDKTYPSITVEIYKRNKNGTISGDPLYTYKVEGSKTVKESLNNVTDWINAKTAPYGLIIRASASDKTSKIDTFTYQTTDTKLNEANAKKASFNKKENINATSTDLTLTDSGYQQYILEAKDKAGNNSKLEFTIKFDNVKPTATLKYEKANNTEYDSTWYNENITASASVSDDISGIKSQTYYKDDDAYESNKSDYYTKSSSTTKVYSDEGNYASKFVVCDYAGNCETSSKTTIKIDKTKPSCDISSSCSKDGNDGWCRGTITLTAGGEDGYSGVKSKSLTNNTIDYDTTGETITETIKDNAGNQNTCDVTVKRDATKPSDPIVHLKKKNSADAVSSASGLSDYSAGSWLNGWVFTYADGSSDTTSGGVYYQYTTTGTTRNDTNKVGTYRNINKEGISYIKYRACDIAGNCSDYSSLYTVELDRSAPSVPTVELYVKDTSDKYTAGSWFSGRVTAKASDSTDAFSGVKEYQFTTTGNTTNETDSTGSSRNVNAEGTSYIKFRACDYVGNCSDYSGSKTIKLDRTAPTVKVTDCRTITSKSGSGNQVKELLIGATDDLSGLYYGEYYSDNDSDGLNNLTPFDFGGYVGQYLLSAEGDDLCGYHVRAKLVNVYDMAGNKTSGMSDYYYCYGSC